MLDRPNLPVALTLSFAALSVLLYLLGLAAAAVVATVGAVSVAVAEVMRSATETNPNPDAFDSGNAVESPEDEE